MLTAAGASQLMNHRNLFRSCLGTVSYPQSLGKVQPYRPSHPVLPGISIRGLIQAEAIKHCRENQTRLLLRIELPNQQVYYFNIG